MTDMIPAMASHLFYSIIQNDPDEAAKLVCTLSEKNPEEIQEETKIESTISSSEKNVEEIKKAAVTKKEEKKDKKLAEKKENIKKKETSNKEKK